MIKVKLKHKFGKNYTPSRFNPIMDTIYECEGDLLCIIDKNLQHHDIQDIKIIHNLDNNLLSDYSMKVKWNNDILNNISYYKVDELIYYDDFEKKQFKNIW